MNFGFSSAQQGVVRGDAQLRPFSASDIASLKAACNGVPRGSSRPRAFASAVAVTTPPPAANSSSAGTPPSGSAAAPLSAPPPDSVLLCGTTSSLLANATRRPHSTRLISQGLKELQRDFSVAATGLTTLYRGASRAYDEGQRTALASARKFALLKARATASGEAVVPLGALLEHLDAVCPPPPGSDCSAAGDLEEVDLAAMGRKRRSFSPQQRAAGQQQQQQPALEWPPALPQQRPRLL